MNSLHLNIPIAISPASPLQSPVSANPYKWKMAQAMAIVGSLGKSFGNSLSRSYATSLGRSWNRDSSLSAHFDSPSGHSPSAELAYISGLEDRFCKNFVCCGLHLENLHDLLQHFEESHVHVESDGEECDFDDDSLPFEFETMHDSQAMMTDDMDEDDMETDDDGFNDQIPSFASPAFIQRQSIALSEIYSARRLEQQQQAAIAAGQQDGSVSAFDTSVVRKLSTKSVTSSATSKRMMGHPPTFTVSNEVKTIPLTFEGPTRIITDIEMDDSTAHGLVPPTMNVNSSGMSHSESLTNGGNLFGSAFDAFASGNSLIGTPSSMIGHGSRSQDDDQISNASTIMTTDTEEDPDAYDHIQNVTINGISLMSLSQFSANTMMPSLEDRPHRCKVEGCNKAYKNPGGLKYHMLHGHCDDSLQKPYKCTVAHCGKRYKNLNGLKYHVEHSHGTVYNQLQQLQQLQQKQQHQLHHQPLHL